MLADGRCAMCRAADGGLASSEPIQLSHFVCRAGSGAVGARIGAVCIIEFLEHSLLRPPSQIQLACNCPHVACHCAISSCCNLPALGCRKGNTSPGVH